MHFSGATFELHQRLLAFFKALAHHSIRHPRLAIVVVALAALATATGLCRLELRTDGHALVSPTAPEVQFDQAIRDEFGLEDQIVVLIGSDHPDGIFNPGTVELVRDLTAEFERLPGIGPSNVISLATEPSFRFRPGTYEIQRLLEPSLTNKVELDQLREDLRRIELYTGTLVSTNGKSTVILISAPTGGDRTQLYQKVLQVISSRRSAEEDVAVTGAPVAESLLGIHILDDLGVPNAWLGSGTGFHPEQGKWKLPGSVYELRLLIAQRIGLIPIAVLVMTLVFYISFRSVPAAVLPLPVVAAALLFTFGLMGWLGVPIYLTIAVMPVLLTAMCVTDEIHLFGRYFTLLQEQPGANHVDLLTQAVDETVRPIVNTTLTTAIGFLSFALSPLRPVQVFGIFTAIGVLFSLLCTLTVVPAMLTLVGRARLRSRRQPVMRGGPSLLSGWFSRIAPVMVRYRYGVLGLLLVSALLATAGLFRVQIQDSWIDGFAPDSEFRRATQIVNEQYHGMHILLVSLDAPRTLAGNVAASDADPGAILLPGELVDDPALIKGSLITLSLADESVHGDKGNTFTHPVWRSHIETVFRRDDRIFARMTRQVLPGSSWEELRTDDQIHFEIVVPSHAMPDIVRSAANLGEFIRAKRHYAVGGLLGPADYLLTTRFMARSNDPNARQIPDNVAEIKLLWDYYALARGPQRLRQIVDTNYWQSLTTVFLKDANFVDTAKLMSDIRAYEREHLTPKGIKLGFAGDVAVSQSLIKGIVTTQMQSLFFALVGIYLVTALFGRSWRWGVYCVVPSALAVVINFALMGWFGIPLGVATSMFAGMTLGIGVDFAIHLLEGYDRARSEGVPQAEALSHSLALTGPPVLINTLAIALGFGVLMLSQVPANARLGMLLALALVNCLIASLLILPVLLHWWPLRSAPTAQPAECDEERP